MLVNYVRLQGRLDRELLGMRLGIVWVSRGVARLVGRVALLSWLPRTGTMPAWKP